MNPPHPNSPRLGLTALLASLALTASGSAATYVYGFENATVGSSLSGNDNWVNSAGGNAVTVTSASPPAGYSGNYITSNSDSQYSRVNNGSFTYDLNNTGTITLSFLLRGSGNAGSQLVALGGNLDNSGAIANNEIGFQFGIVNTSWVVRQAVFGTTASAANGLPNNGTDTYEVRLVVDPTANLGNGSGDFSFRNISTSGSWTDVAGLQDVNLGMLNMASGARTPSEWNSLFTRLTSGRIDTISISQVPEPSAALLGSIGLLLSFRRRRA